MYYLIYSCPHIILQFFSRCCCDWELWWCSSGNFPLQISKLHLQQRQACKSTTAVWCTNPIYSSKITYYSHAYFKIYLKTTCIIIWYINSNSYTLCVMMLSSVVVDTYWVMFQLEPISPTKNNAVKICISEERQLTDCGCSLLPYHCCSRQNCITFYTTTLLNCHLASS